MKEKTDFDLGDLYNNFIKGEYMKTEDLKDIIKRAEEHCRKMQEYGDSTQKCLGLIVELLCKLVESEKEDKDIKKTKKGN